MDTIFMNSKTIYPKRLLLNLADKYIYEEVKTVLLYPILVFIINKKIKNSYNSNNFKMSGPTWNDKV